ncbi:aminoglycoside 3-N-acetyltransferase [Prosthecobacter debontii]|uniref:Aminoglycoside N(3)-acetyltransferase n=1 Tax=Prosthecobacter debontii TaxID=48467 RepID=A0A1T4XTK6_9BACT|nr:AAC(3) family N-acetyltransferase [Prosthecobacter debontii]SKA92882.1 aminoglycoside 3-N-acetyltransferase [Prosthecobacter debontii]
MTSRTHYTTEDIKTALCELGVASGDDVYVSGNFGSLGFHESKSKTGTLEAHHEAIRAVIGPEGTLVVPTHSFDLCNTEIVFDSKVTPSQRGPFTEFIRQMPGAVRQFHPFGSVTALGASAGLICEKTTRHAYGPNTPYERLLHRDAWSLSVGMPPQTTCSLVHHLEMTMAVPYRYTKEFLHPVKRSEEVVIEPFYLFVTYQGIELERDRNAKFFAHPLMVQHVRQVRIGMNQVWAYKMRVFEQVVRECMTEDIYAWLRHPPEIRPFQK